jgi:hypothetical protein
VSGRFLLPAVALALALPAALHAQVIRGVVFEDGSSQPVVGATIELLRADSTTQASVESDARGWFHLDAGRAGTYLLRPSHAAYRAAGLDSVSVGQHEIVTVVLRMGPSVIPLERLVVTARSRDRLSAVLERAEQGQPGRFVLRDYIESRVTARPSELLRMAPGVRVDPVAGDPHSNLITMRGPGGRCAAALFLDGLPVSQTLGTSIDNFTAADLLEGVEIYDAYTVPPAELRVVSNDCGVIAFWSRRDAHRPFSWKRVALGALIGGAILLLAR